MKSVKLVVAIGIGSALYGVLSAVSLPLGANVDLRPAVAILSIFGGIFGPLVGFFAGLIGHIVNDLIRGYGFWPTWALYSGIMGMSAGLFSLRKSVDITRGLLPKQGKIELIAYGLVGIWVGSAFAATMDVLVYGEPADKMWVQGSLIGLSNSIVFAVVSVPLIIYWAKRKASEQNLTKQ